MNTDTVKIVTCDSKEFEISENTAKTFGAVKEMMESLADNEAVIPVPTIPSHFFKEIVNFVEQCYQNPNMETAWVNNVSQNKIYFFCMLQSVNHLNYPYLLKMLSKKMADKISEISKQYESNFDTAVTQVKDYLEYSEADFNKCLETCV